MALSQRKTTVAKLRAVLGPVHGQEKRFAKLAGKSVSWVKKVSAGLIPLSEETAQVLQLETGVSLYWLLAKKAGEPVDSHDNRYSFARFEEHRTHRPQTAGFPFMFARDLAAIGSAAGAKKRAALFVWRLKAFLDECREEFGFDEGARAKAAAAVRRAGLEQAVPFHDRGMDPYMINDPRIVKAFKKARKGKGDGEPINITVDLRSKRSRRKKPK